MKSRNLILRRAMLALLLASATFSAGCSESDGANSSSGSSDDVSLGGDDELPQMKPERQEVLHETAPFISDDNLQTTLDVDWKDELTLIEADQLDALIDYDWTTQTYIFDAGLAEQSNIDLTPGRPLLIAGLTLRMITSANRQGDRIVVETDHATLEDAIQDGEVGLSYDTEFTNEMFEFSTMRYQKLVVKDGIARAEQPITVGTDNISVTVNNDGSVTYTATVGDYTYKMDFSLEGDQFRTAFNVTKSLGGETKIRYSINGTVRAPNNSLNATYSGGKLSTFDYDTSGLSGEITLRVVAAGSGPDEFVIKLPAPIFKFPILIGGVIPAVIEIDVAFGFNATVPISAMGSVQLENTYSFGGDMGFHLADRSVEAQGQLGNFSTSDGGLDFASDFSPVNASLSVGFPRIGVSMLGNSVSAAVQPVFALNGQLTFGPVCQRASWSFLGNGKYDVSLFGAIPIDSGVVDFFEKEGETLQDSCEGQ